MKVYQKRCRINLYAQLLYSGQSRRLTLKRIPSKTRPSQAKLLIQPIKLDQFLHNLNHPVAHIIRCGTKTRVVNARRDDFIQHETQSRDENADAGPTAKPQPAVNDETTAHGIEGDGSAEEEEGVRVESWTGSQYCFYYRGLLGVGMGMGMHTG